MREIKDFGEHIGGARKELYARLQDRDISSFTDAEKRAFVKKSNLWPTPNYFEIKEAKGSEVAYMTKLIYSAIPTTSTNDYETYISYVDTMKGVCDDLDTIENSRVCELMSEQGLLEAVEYSNGYKRYVVKNNLIDRKMSRVLRATPSQIKREIKEKQFCMSGQEIGETKYFIVGGEDLKKEFDLNRQQYRLRLKIGYGLITIWPDEAEQVTNDGYVVVENENWRHVTPCATKEEADAIRAEKIDEFVKTYEAISKIKKTKKTSKKKFVPAHLENIIRKGDVCRKRNITGNSYLKTYKFRGGEFGNWLNQNERQVVLNYGYEALYDLAKALNISLDSVSLGGKLAIAFGARGHGSALAHYEPLRNVINLTKLKGAGSLAHEWAHALDAFIATSYELRRNFATDGWYPSIPEVKAIVDSMKRINYKETEFYKKSKEMDESYSKDFHGYWHSDIEMFARLFACYVKDKLKEQGMRSDYLCGHAEASGAIPNAEEKKVLYPLVDALIEKLVVDGKIKRDL